MQLIITKITGFKNAMELLKNKKSGILQYIDAKYRIYRCYELFTDFCQSLIDGVFQLSGHITFYFGKTFG